MDIVSNGDLDVPVKLSMDILNESSTSGGLVLPLQVQYQTLAERLSGDASKMTKRSTQTPSSY